MGRSQVDFCQQNAYFSFFLSQNGNGNGSVTETVADCGVPVSLFTAWYNFPHGQPMLEEQFKCNANRREVGVVAEISEPKRSGTFFVARDREIYGEITLAGAESRLYLQDGQLFHTHDIRSCVKGSLRDLTKVSMIDCVTPQVAGSYSSNLGSFYFASVFPHFVIEGDQHISPGEKTISAVYFQIDDSLALFYDFDAFGFLLDARPFIDQIAQANILNRKIATGPDPEILYFTGKREIFVADTVLGRVSASHNPSHSLGGPGGVSLRNRIVISITFYEKLDFHLAIHRVSVLLDYLGMLVGRPQNLLGLQIRVGEECEKPIILKVYWSIAPKRNTSNESEKPHPSDVLLDAVRNSEDFSHTLANWLNRHEEWRDARWRFFSSFAKQRLYDIDRLIGSANMFDILPATALPPDVELTSELQKAKDSARESFLRLPPTPERDSVLGALGRIGKCSLKQKVRYRAKRVTEAVGEHFRELTTVTDEAVNCRNHYVHGSKQSFDYNRNFDAVTFFTDTLEFVFGISDLIEAGWDVKAWSTRGTTMSHPFGRYLATYNPGLQMLKSLLT